MLLRSLLYLSVANVLLRSLLYLSVANVLLRSLLYLSVAHGWVGGWGGVCCSWMGGWVGGWGGGGRERERETISGVHIWTNTRETPVILACC